MGEVSRRGPGHGPDSEAAAPDRQLLDYYARRAAEYEAVYAKPERQADLARLRALVACGLAGRRVLELACGTGYWTEVIAGCAASVVASDLGAQVLATARAKTYPPGRVEFAELDALALPPLVGRFSAVFAGFLWSHIPRQRLAAFLAGLGVAVGPAVEVLFLDNRFVPGSSTPVSRRDDDGNTYQLRRLADGSEHEVLKNFPARAELEATVAPFGLGAVVAELEYYWALSYRTAAPGEPGPTITR